MANKLTQVKTGGIADDAITDAKLPASSVGASELQDNAVGLGQIAAGTDGQVITYDASGDPVAVGPGTDGQVLTSTGSGSPPAFEDSVSEGTQVKSTTNSYEAASKFLRADGDGTSSWNEVTASSLASTLDLSGKTVTLPAASVTAHVTQYNDDVVMSNIAMLGFKVAAANDLAKFSLVDQIIDEYEDASGIDASASTNETLTSGAYSGSGTQSVTPTCTGGSIATDGDYKVHTITADGDYVTDTTQDIDILVIAGGGGGSGHGGGGGGAGGLIYITSWSLAAGTHAVDVGAGGAHSSQGSDSTFGTGPLLTAIGGGRGSGSDSSGGTTEPWAGGSGGGSSRVNVQFPGLQPSQSGDSGTYGFGNDGGVGVGTAWGDPWGCGGGGGSGAAGANANTSSPYQPGAGGNGKSVSITGSAVTYAGGGGSGNHINHTNGHASSGGSGGGGAGSTGNPAADAGDATGYGSGGGGAGINNGGGGGTGSAGVVIIRRKTTFSQTTYNDLTLQSTATTAQSAPTKADLVILVENAAGTATINTDLKGYISRDGSAFSSAVTFVDEGTWGTNKKIYAAHDVDISGITSGTSMKYKITTHNQAVGKQTKIHATSLGWR